MKIKLHDIKVNLDYDDAFLKNVTAKRLKIDKKRIVRIDIKRRAIDSRRGEVKYSLSLNVIFDTDDPICSNKNITNLDITRGKNKRTFRPVVAGCGPAGLFCALVLAENGYKPILIERGQAFDDRKQTVNAFMKGKGLNLESNVYFGEGGAGTFSDGKLVTRVNDKRCRYILEKLVECGASEEILIDARPHIGTDILSKVIMNLRKRIIQAGGQVLFEEKLEDFTEKDGRISDVKTNNNIISTDVLVLATGHGAKDIYRMLNSKNIIMQAKPFAVGLRIEHPREMIDKAIYGKYASDKRLGAASYNLKAKFNSYNVFSFCMCPGGQIINSSTQTDGLCINGMSFHARDGMNSNAAIVCQIMPEKWGSDAMAGISYQENIEKKAYKLGDTDHIVPVQRVCDFIDGIKKNVFDEVKPSVKPGFIGEDLNLLLDKDINSAIKSAILYFDNRIPGYSMGGAVLSGIESRTASPVRIIRDEAFESVSLKGLYPCGEGAGYAGGIMSSALDGIKCAIAIIEK